MDYDEEKGEFDERVTALADALHVATGDPWQAELTQGLNARMVLLDGRGIFVRSESGRLRFSGCYPRLEASRDYSEFGLNYGETHVITCDPERELLAIARDIQRRFLPDYQVYWERGLAERAQHVAEIKVVAGYAVRLSEAWDAEVKPDVRDPRHAAARLYPTTHGMRVNLKVSYYDGGRVNVELEDLDIEEAAQVGLLLREMREVERGELPVTDDGPCEVLDGVVDATMAVIGKLLHEAHIAEAGKDDRGSMLDTARDLCRGLVLTGLEMAAVVGDENGVGGEK